MLNSSTRKPRPSLKTLRCHGVEHACQVTPVSQFAIQRSFSLSYGFRVRLYALNCAAADHA